jgi:hypothetical protein
MDHTADAMEILRQFGLDVGGVHEVQNLLSLQYELGFSFGVLETWFKGTNKVRHPETPHYCRLSTRIA